MVFEQFFADFIRVREFERVEMAAVSQTRLNHAAVRQIDREHWRETFVTDLALLR